MLLDFKKYGVTKIISPLDVHRLVRRAIVDMEPFDQDKESFFAIGLTRASTIKYFDLVAMGGLKSITVEPGGVFRHAVLHAAASIMISHNHPSGRVKPSKQDIETTKTLYTAAKILEIPLIDHVIVGGDDLFSFANEGMLW